MKTHTFSGLIMTLVTICSFVYFSNQETIQETMRLNALQKSQHNASIIASRYTPDHIKQSAMLMPLGISGSVL